MEYGVNGKNGNYCLGFRVCGDLIVIYPKPYSIFSRGTNLHSAQCSEACSEAMRWNSLATKSIGRSVLHLTGLPVFSEMAV